MFVLDVGTADGIKEGQYVINGEGLIGKITEVNKNTSKVITILDSKAYIPVQISSIGETGMLSGYGVGSDGKLCKVNYLSIETKAKEGDVVVTSNIVSNADNLVPSDIIVGFVQRVEDEKPNLAKAAYVKPVVDFSKIEKVLVIIK
jgi:rod shape-determining protein MreC